MIYLLIDTSKKVNVVLHATSDSLKTEHWKELLNIQCIDCIIATIDKEMIDTIISLNNGLEND